MRHNSTKQHLQSQGHNPDLLRQGKKTNILSGGDSKRTKIRPRNKRLRGRCSQRERERRRDRKCCSRASIKYPNDQRLPSRWRCGEKKIDIFQGTTNQRGCCYVYIIYSSIPVVTAWKVADSSQG